MKAKPKYKGRSGISKVYHYNVTVREERKALRKERRMIHGKDTPKEKSKYYLFIYKANLTEKDVSFARLHQLKLVDSISILSDSNSFNKVDELLKARKSYPDNNEIKYNNFVFDKILECPDGVLDIRKRNEWEIALSPDRKIVNGETVLTYTCFTNLHYLKYLANKHFWKGILLQSAPVNAIHPKKKTIELKHFSNYLALIKNYDILVTNKFLAEQCIDFGRKYGHTIHYINNDFSMPKTVTKNKHKRKQRVGQENHKFEYDPVKQRLVCITDGVTVTRTKQYLAEKIIAKHPNIKYCKKSEFYKYQNEISRKPLLPKDKRELVRELSTQGAKNNSKDTRVRKERRLVRHKTKHYSRHYFSQFIPACYDEETNEYFPSKTITVHKNPYKYFPRQPHRLTRLRKERLMRKYKEYFKQEERRDGKFSSLEKWSVQFMELLKMVNSNEPERKIALKLSEIFPGWNDKKMKRFIQYLKLTKHGLNYKPNKKSIPVIKYETVEKKVKGIEISKIPYHKPITVEYKQVDSEGTEKIVKERNVFVQYKKVVKEDPETKETIVICPVTDIVRWVGNDEFVDNESCPWKQFITIKTFTKTSKKKIPFHLPKPKEKIKKWKCPIEPNEDRWKRHGEIIEKKWLTKDKDGIRDYITSLVKTMNPNNIKQFAIFIGSTQFRDVVQDSMKMYMGKRYFNTPMSQFLFDVLPF